jgi:hypothetical protein
MSTRFFFCCCLLLTTFLSTFADESAWVEVRSPRRGVTDAGKTVAVRFRLEGLAGVPFSAEVHCCHIVPGVKEPSTGFVFV